MDLLGRLADRPFAVFLFPIGLVYRLGRLMTIICKIVLYIKVRLHTIMDYLHSHQEASPR